MRIHHLAFRTPDVSSLVHFYRELLGLIEVATQPHSVWLRSGDAVVMIEAIEPGETTVAHTNELVAFAVDHHTQKRLRDTLAAAGFAREAHTEATDYYRDPDGRRVGLSTYPLP
ncbi:MAG: VOC family protein [Myxococcota bacterium]